MKRQTNASMAFIKSTPTEKSSLGQTVIEALTTNAATFPHLPISIATLTTNNSDLIAALLAARSGEHLALAYLYAIVRTWNTNFRYTAKYVSLVANGVPATVILGGFVPTKSETTPASKPVAPSPVAVSINGTKGNFSAACPAVSGAISYVFTAAPEGASVNYNDDTMMITVGGLTVYVIVSTRGKADFCNVPSGTEMNVSAYAVNSAGCGSPANGQSIIPQ
jgi:hypothetical protein